MTNEPKSSGATAGRASSARTGAAKRPFYGREREVAELRSGLADVVSRIGLGGSSIAELVPELGRRIVRRPGESKEIDYEHARFYLFDAATSFLKAIAATQPLVIVLDDLHAADEASLLLLRFLAQ